MISFYNTATGLTTKYYQSMIDAIDSDAPLINDAKPIMYIASQFRPDRLLLTLWTVKQKQTEIPVDIWPYQNDIVEWLSGSAYNINVLSSIEEDTSVPDLYSAMLQQSPHGQVRLIYSDTEHRYPSRRNDIFINSRKETQDDIVQLALHTQIETHWNVGYAEIYDSPKIKVHKNYGSNAEGQGEGN